MDVFLTGATGFLGGEILMDLSERKEVGKIFCLVRAKSQAEALERVKKVFFLHGDFFDENRIIPVAGDLSRDSLVDELIANKSLENVGVIIHSAANTSFSKIFDTIVKDVNIEGLKRILKWSTTLKKLETFVYVGTATICGKNILNRVVLEEESPDVNAEHVVSYTYTKMTGEQVLKDYLREDQILVVRPSIIMGDSRPWAPRSTVILWTLATVNLLRLVPVNPLAQLDIISVDFASKAIVALLFAKRNHQVYHVSSGQVGASNALQITSAIEPHFNHRPPFKFVNTSHVKQMVAWAKNHPPKPGDELHGNTQHLSYWNDIFESRGRLRILLFALEPYLEFMELGQVFDNSKLLSDTGMKQPLPAHEYIKNSVKYLEKIDVFEGAVDP
jgi:thioester reductase-like protein